MVDQIGPAESQAVASAAPSLTAVSRDAYRRSQPGGDKKGSSVTLTP